LGYDNEHQVDAIGGMFMLIKREAGDAVGWWDEDYEFYGEDLDLCYRLWQKNLPVLYYPQVTLNHYKGVTTGMSPASRSVTTATQKTNRQVRAWSVRAMELFYRKHYLHKYPFFINGLVFIGIKLMYLIRVKLA
jgi:GT2 family glycosyltransferase